MVANLNRVLRGWGAYFRHGNSVRKFVVVDIGAVRALVLDGDTAALLGHSSSWFVVWSLLCPAFILVVLATRKFTKV